MERQKFGTTTFSRRQALRASALGTAGLASLTLLGCGEQKPAEISQVSQAPQAKRGGTVHRRVTEAQGAYALGLDPHVVQVSHAGNQAIFYQSLIRVNSRSFAVEQEIAEKWEQPSQTEYLFSLTPGVKWHNKPPANGRLLTAEDVVFSLNRARTNDPKFLSRSLLDPVDKIEAIDKATVKVTLKLVDVSALINIATPTLAILAPEVVERAAGKFTTAETAVGTGAFILQSMDDVNATMVRNPDFWKPGLPYLDGVTNTSMTDDQVAWAAFLAGQFDLNSNVPGEEAKKVSADPNKKFAAEWFNDVSLQGMMAHIEKPPFNDPRVTRALRLLVDHEEAVSHWAETWFGRGYLSAALPATLADWDLTEQEYVTKHLEYKRPKDEAAREAIRLLGAAGFTRDNPIKFDLTARSTPPWAVAGAELLQAQFRRLGQGAVQVDQIRFLNGPQLLQATVQGQFDYVMLGTVPGQTFDPDPYFRTFYYTNGSRNYGKYSDPALDRLIDRQRTIFDVAQRKAAVKDVITHIIDNAPYNPWSGRYQLNAAQPNVKDWAPEANSARWGHHFSQVWLDV